MTPGTCLIVELAIYNAILTCNYRNLIRQVEELSNNILADCQQKEGFNELISILNSVTNPDFLNQLASSRMIKFSYRTDACSPIVATEFLLELNQQEDIEIVWTVVLQKLADMIRDLSFHAPNHCDFINKILVYVEYVSKKFIWEIGSNFSNYLTDLRIQKAKELLADGDSEKIQIVAEAVGCGNNP